MKQEIYWEKNLLNSSMQFSDDFDLNLETPEEVDHRVEINRLCKN
jgi:hypothetical protein